MPRGVEHRRVGKGLDRGDIESLFSYFSSVTLFYVWHFHTTLKYMPTTGTLLHHFLEKNGYDRRLTFHKSFALLITILNLFRAALESKVQLIYVSRQSPERVSRNQIFIMEAKGHVFPG